MPISHSALLLSLAVLFVSLITAADAQAATYYLSPSGSDTNIGTSATSPWKTFGKAFTSSKLLKPGDGLVLLDGTYTRTTTGFPAINCSLTGNANSGTASAPITLKSQNERRAHLKGDGSATLVSLVDCAWWVIEGLHIENADNASSATGGGINVRGPLDANVVIRRNLLHHPNRYANAGLINVSSGSHYLIEENELYFFHRNALVCINAFGPASNCIVRRNYVNIRDGRSTCPTVGNDWCDSDPAASIDMYASSDQIVENNISESTHGTIAGGGRRNRFLGNISIRIGGGNLFGSSKHPAEYVQDVSSTWENNVGIASLGTVNGLLHRSAASTVHRNNSIFGGTGNGVALDNAYDSRRGPGACGSYHPSCLYQVSPAISTENTLVQDTAGGYSIGHADEFSKRRFEYSVGWNNANGTWRFGTSGTNPDGTSVRDLATTPPAGVSATTDIGTCRMWIPSTSSLKGKGKGGKDIGANILYAYENGVLTTKTLWDSVSGQWRLRGVIIPDVNDIAGQSLFDVHKRLNVNFNGCSLPAGYGSGTPPPPPSSFLSGDLNSDGKVNASDLQLEVNVILGTETNSTIRAKADLNGDGQVNALDLQRMVNLILGV